MTVPLVAGLVSYDPRGQLHEAELTIVREELDGLTRRRSMTGLSPPEEARYNELCVGEQALLDMSALEPGRGFVPQRTRHHR
jgi:hypothetical protein